MNIELARAIVQLFGFGGTPTDPNAALRQAVERARLEAEARQLGLLAGGTAPTAQWGEFLTPGVAVLVGDRGCGKSGVLAALASVIDPQSVYSSAPFPGVQRLDLARCAAIPDQALVLVDESAIDLPAQRVAAEIRAALALARHRSQRWIWAAQSAAWVPLDVLRTADLIVGRVRRPELERDELRDMIAQAQGILATAPPWSWAVAEKDSARLLPAVQLPGWWSESVSRYHSRT